MTNLAKELARKWSWLGAQGDFQISPLRTIFRFISWRGRCALRKRTTVEIRKWSLRILLPPRWKGVEKLIFVFRENYEAELAFLERALSPGNTFVDVGANLGIYALVASRIVGPSGRVIAFEPSQQSFFLLKENVALNSFTNVQIYRVAVSDRTGKAFLYHGADPGENSLGKDPRLGSEGEEVETQSLDNALGQASVERVDLIKMDVEGAEELVVRGANKIVASHKPAIIFEVNQEASARLGLSPRGAWDQLKSLGYKFFSVKSNGVHKANSLPLLGNVVAIYGSPEP
jgi:FkbM family methyltransferase